MILEAGKQYITRDGEEYTAPLQKIVAINGGFYFLATTYKIATGVSTATRTWNPNGYWTTAGIQELDLDLVAEYKPEEIKMIDKVIVNIEAGKTYRTREGKEVTLEHWDEYTLTGTNEFLYSKSLTGSVYSDGLSDFDIVEEIVEEPAKEPVTTFTTQQEIYKHLVDGGYISCGGMNIVGFTEEGGLASFDKYGAYMSKTDLTFYVPSDWQAATIEPKPVPRWEDALKDKKIACRVGDDKNCLDNLAFVVGFAEDNIYPYLVHNDGYKFAIPLTLEEVTNYIYDSKRPSSRI